MSVTHSDAQVPLSDQNIQTLIPQVPPKMSSLDTRTAHFGKPEIANTGESFVVLEAAFGTGKAVVELAPSRR